MYTAKNGINESGFSEILADSKHSASQYYKHCRWLIWHYRTHPPHHHQTDNNFSPRWQRLAAYHLAQQQYPFLTSPVIAPSLTFNPYCKPLTNIEELHFKR